MFSAFVGIESVNVFERYSVKADSFKSAAGLMRSEYSARYKVPEGDIDILGLRKE